MLGLIILGNGFEVSEAIVPLDYLFRAGIKVDKVSVHEDKVVTSQEGIKVIADKLLKDIDLSLYDFLFIPGGKASFTVLDKIDYLNEVIAYFFENNKLVVSICAAPFLLGRLSYLKDKNYTCFPSFKKYVIGGNYLKDEGVVKDKNVITAKSVYYATPFALEIIEALLGKDKRDQVEAQIKAEN